MNLIVIARCSKLTYSVLSSSCNCLLGAIFAWKFFIGSFRILALCLCAFFAAPIVSSLERIVRRCGKHQVREGESNVGFNNRDSGLPWPLHRNWNLLSQRYSHRNLLSPITGLTCIGYGNFFDPSFLWTHYFLISIDIPQSNIAPPPISVAMGHLVHSNWRDVRGIFCGNRRRNRKSSKSHRSHVGSHSANRTPTLHRR